MSSQLQSIPEEQKTLQQPQQQNQNQLVFVKSGKVRDIYEYYTNQMVFQHSNRLSAYDSNICDIPNKGAILNYTNAYWMNMTRHIIPNHYVWHSGSVLVARKCTPILLEVIVRGYITGSSSTSLWTLYKEGRHGVYGITLPEGLQQHQRLSEPVVTPTTKGEHDIPCDDAYITNPDNKLLTSEQWAYVKQKALELYTFGAQVAAGKGLILVDTKYEFGIDNETGEIILIDECHTCDSSRYWVADTYEERLAEGKSPQNLDKDQVRRWIDTNYPEFKSMELSHRPKLVIPEKERISVSQTYQALYERLTGNNDTPFSEMSTNIGEIYNYYLQEMSPVVLIFSGSTSDQPFINKLLDHGMKQGLNVQVRFGSAHKEIEKVFGYIQQVRDWQRQGRRMVLIAVAGLSNALGGCLAGNLPGVPVLNVPPLKDNTDIMVNLGSSMMMPRNVPAPTILHPGNAMMFARSVLRMGI
jgi:phosphoribosylaminoimidazole-succinocarboxamide synthase